MGPMITYHDTVALQFPLKSLHHEETPRIPKTQTLPTQDHEKTSPSPQIEVSPLGSPHQLLSPLTKNRAQHGNNRRRAPSPRRLRAAESAFASLKLSDDSEEEVLNEKTKPTKKEGISGTNEIKQEFDKRSPTVLKENVADVGVMTLVWVLFVLIFA